MKLTDGPLTGLIEGSHPNRKEQFTVSLKSLSGRKKVTFTSSHLCLLVLLGGMREAWGSSPPVREVCTDCLWPVDGSGRWSPFRSLSPGLDWQVQAPGAAGCWPVPQAKAPGGISALGERSGLGDPLGRVPADSQKS